MKGGQTAPTLPHPLEKVTLKKSSLIRVGTSFLLNQKVPLSYPITIQQDPLNSPIF